MTPDISALDSSMKSFWRNKDKKCETQILKDRIE